MQATTPGYLIRKLADAPSVPCPCGVSTRPLAAAVLTAFSAVATVRVWRRSIGSRLARWQLTVVTLACLAFLALLQLWNLLGYHW